jgi:hypothetical protein
MLQQGLRLRDRFTMATSHRIAGLVLAAAACLVPAAASAGSVASGSYRLMATVPVSCWVRPDGVIDSATGHGSVVEACNSPGGFQVTASHRPLAAGESATLRYGERLVALGGGEALLKRSHMAQIRTVDYRFEETVLDAPLVLVLSIQPF